MGNLYAALRQARLRTFMDEGVLKGGDVADTIIQALEASRVSIVILSETFASSRWCLDELVNILDCMKTKNQTVIPIFYNVDPSDVRNLKGSFGAAMVAHEDGFGKDNERLQKWRSALTQVANLSGCCLGTGSRYVSLSSTHSFHYTFSNMFKSNMLITCTLTRIQTFKYVSVFARCI